MTFKRTRLKAPYNTSGRTNFPARGVAGVYLIYKGGTLRYVGFSGSDVYKALYRHFETWNDRRGTRGPRMVYDRNTCTVRVVYTNRPGQAAELERALILTRHPSDNHDKLELYRVTPHGRDLVREAEAAGFVIGDEAPF